MPYLYLLIQTPFIYEKYKAVETSSMYNAENGFETDALWWDSVVELSGKKAPKPEMGG